MNASLAPASLADELLDELLPEDLDWKRLVRTYPLPALAVAAAGGYLLGRHRGRALIAALSGMAAGVVAEHFEAVFER